MSAAVDPRGQPDRYGQRSWSRQSIEHPSGCPFPVRRPAAFSLYRGATRPVLVLAGHQGGNAGGLVYIYICTYMNIYVYFVVLGPSEVRTQATNIGIRWDVLMSVVPRRWAATCWLWKCRLTVGASSTRLRACWSSAIERCGLVGRGPVFFFDIAQPISVLTWTPQRCPTGPPPRVRNPMIIYTEDNPRRLDMPKAPGPGRFGGLPGPDRL